MKRLSFSQTGDDSVDINLSPLIDMMFLLLIFFIVTTTFVDEVGIEIQKPRAAAAGELSKNSIMIGVTEDGHIIHGEQEISLSALRILINRQMRSNPKPVIILADKRSRSGILVDVIDECRNAGAEQVSIATETE